MSHIAQQCGKCFLVRFLPELDEEQRAQDCPEVLVSRLEDRIWGFREASQQVAVLGELAVCP